jgi:hypothetical protein
MIAADKYMLLTEIAPVPYPAQVIGQTRIVCFRRIALGHYRVTDRPRCGEIPSVHGSQPLSIHTRLHSGFGRRTSERAVTCGLSSGAENGMHDTARAQVVSPKKFAALLSFMRSQSAGGLALIIAAGIALVWQSHLHGSSMVCDIGFTMSLFFGDLSFSSSPLHAGVKLAPFLASAIWALGLLVLALTRQPGSKSAAHESHET